MKCPIKHRDFALVLVTSVLCARTAEQLSAQTLKPLHYFDRTTGATPYAELVVSGSKLYGSAYSGGNWSNGTLFAVNIDGTGFTNLHHFSSAFGSFPRATNSDGVYPNALSLRGTTLCGTAQGGGASAHGTLFALNTDGSGFTNLHSFTAVVSGTNADGRYPRGKLLPTDNMLYGTAEHGGDFGSGSVFGVNPDGTGFTNLHSFTPNNLGPLYTNVDGANPFAGLSLSGGTLFGTTYEGGRLGGGVVFAIKTDGGGFTNLFSFEAAPYPDFVNTGGAMPYAGLTQAGSTLFGAAYYGGSAGNGTLFKLNADGTEFANLHVFSALVSNTNYDGAYPSANLVLVGDTLFGATPAGGSAGNGTLFAIKTNGTAFTNLHSFTSLVSGTNRDGAYPIGLALGDYALYGVANSGGISGCGTVFSFSFAPQLQITCLRATVVLRWPTNNTGFDYGGFKLQCTTNFQFPLSWTAVLPEPLVVDEKYTVTNSVSVPKFYRLVR